MGRSPIPGYRPDIIGKKLGSQSQLREEVLVEVEADENSLWNEHSINQLRLLNRYCERKLKHKRKGILGVPSNLEKQAKCLCRLHKFDRLIVCAIGSSN